MSPGRRADEVIVSADGRRAALRNHEPSEVQIVEIPTGTTIHAPIRLPADPALALDPAGSRLAVGGGRGRVEVIELASGTRRTLTGPVPLLPFERDGAQDYTPPVGRRRLAFAPDSRALASSGPRAFASLWDGRHVRRLRSPVPPGPQGWTVASPTAGGSWPRTAPVGRDRRLARGAGGGTRADAARSPAGLRCSRAGRARADRHGSRPPAVARRRRGRGQRDGRRAQRRTGEQRAELRTGRGAISSLVFSPSGRVLSVVDAGDTVWHAGLGPRLPPSSSGASRPPAPSAAPRRSTMPGSWPSARTAR